ncbi:hypothetical protein SAMN04515691_3788 [Leifsonia sp. 98AMF]|jgi:hypothetical protein|nr:MULTISPECIES: hypothetical protein [Microbacteriaceae]TDQ01926.1 hypothetical protein AXZ95_0188 [Leifsonia sp. 115AMFTsu3.1]SDH00218.1 hypothetical protein SAMN04515690_0228 [Leifsonia sp. 197AMF]SDJ41182.1 hypothetical protein SAMN04515684_3553 [Leifsonia sp. 466MF]SDK36063.1 hypothetical protein SAMN04515683_3211 [Leifsonia sp. 157MF]SDN61555.1 hypothetical protein SAMN04515686_1740 [Leifsonia sp. 509MF]
MARQTTDQQTEDFPDVVPEEQMDPDIVPAPQPAPDSVDDGDEEDGRL